jgi:hypothetical protein
MLGPWRQERRAKVGGLTAPTTPQEAERVWKSQARPSARSVAIVLTHAGRRAVMGDARNESLRKKPLMARRFAAIRFAWG